MTGPAIAVAPSPAIAPTDDECGAAAEHQPSDVAPLGAERHANRDLPPSLPDAECERGIESDRAEHEGERPERHQERPRRANVGEFEAEARAERPDVSDGYISVDGGDGAAHRGKQGRGVAGYANVRPGVLRPVLRAVLLPEHLVRDRRGCLEDAEVLQILHDADDFAPAIADSQRAAHGASLRPEATRQRLVDDRGRRSVWRVALIELAAFDDGDAECLEVAWPDVGGRCLKRSSGIGRIAGELHRHRRTGTNEAAEGLLAGLAAITPGRASSRRITSR